MQNYCRLFQHNSPLDSGQLARARESLELQSRVQDLVNTLRNVYGDVCHIVTATSLAPRSLFSPAGILEAVEHQLEFTAPLR